MRRLWSRRQEASDAYVLRPPYAAARAELLAKPPPDRGAKPDGRAVWAVVADAGLEHYLLSVYVFADGTIAIYGSGGIHTTGLRGAARVNDIARQLLDEAERALGGFERLPDVSAAGLPGPDQFQLILRTYDGDVWAKSALPPRNGPLRTLGLLVNAFVEAARLAVAEGFDAAGPGDVLYEIDPEYRKIRRTLLDWEPSRNELASTPCSVCGVAVEFSDGRVITSVFAFADGSTSLFRSDGRVSEGLSGVAPIRNAAAELLAAAERALQEFAPFAGLPPPQPGVVQFVVRLQSLREHEGGLLRALVDSSALAGGAHPLSVAFERANEIRRLAEGRRGASPGLAPDLSPGRSAGRSRPE